MALDERSEHFAELPGFVRPLTSFSGVQKASLHTDQYLSSGFSGRAFGDCQKPSDLFVTDRRADRFQTSRSS